MLVKGAPDILPVLFLYYCVSLMSESNYDNFPIVYCRSHPTYAFGLAGLVSWLDFVIKYGIFIPGIQNCCRDCRRIPTNHVNCNLPEKTHNPSENLYIINTGQQHISFSHTCCQISLWVPFQFQLWANGRNIVGCVMQCRRDEQSSGSEDFLIMLYENQIHPITIND